MAKYFEIFEDASILHRWHLGEMTDAAGIEVDCRDFTYGKFVTMKPHLQVSLRARHAFIRVTQPLQIELQYQGPPLDFTFGAFNYIVASPRTALLLENACGASIQVIPARIPGRRGFKIINCTRAIDCIDESRSEIEYRRRGVKKRDPRRFAMIDNLTINVRRTRSTPMFRPKYWEQAVVVSNNLRFALETAKVTGILFRECSL